LPARSWAAIALGSAGIGWMFARDIAGGGRDAVLGMAIALAVPLAAATNWTLLQHARERAARRGASRPDESRAAAGDEADHADLADHANDDMLLAVLLGALVSALAVLPLAWPLRAGAHDLGLLALLGIFQLALPCLLVVRLARVLAAPELALLGLLEVIFGVLWAWLGAGEDPSSAALTGGAMVLVALLGNELLAWRQADDNDQRENFRSEA
ncbi:MAG: DMT family transporter, partial [Burkholderiaceae bacterium]